MRSKLNKFEHVQGPGAYVGSRVRALYRGVPGMGRFPGTCPVERQKDMTENITFPQLHWWSVMNTNGNLIPAKHV